MWPRGLGEHKWGRLWAPEGSDVLLVGHTLNKALGAPQGAYDQFLLLPSLFLMGQA